MLPNELLEHKCRTPSSGIDLPNKAPPRYEHTAIADLKQRLLAGSAKAKPQQAEPLSQRVLKDVLGAVFMARVGGRRVGRG